MLLSLPLEKYKRINPAYLKKLHKLNIKTIEDLLYHFPHRYDDFSKLTFINAAKINEIITVQGKICHIKNTRTWKKRMFLTEAIIGDATGTIKAIWFNQPFLINNLQKGQIVNLAGKIHYDSQRGLYFSNPAYERIININKLNNSLKHTGRLVPIYPETEGLSSRWLRYIIKTILPAFSQIKDYLPPEIKTRQNLFDLKKALEQIHFPDTENNVRLARRRLAFDELFLIQLVILRQKIKWQMHNAACIAFNQPLIKKFVASLPFELTNAQRKAAWEILQDLAKNQPMNRLLEGDVGSGKTVIAALSALEVVSDKSLSAKKTLSDIGYQVALMAPTEILAQQHFQEIANLLNNFKPVIGLLTSSETKICQEKYSKIGKKELLKQISEGQIQIIIGTHSLIQEKVHFKKLALVIVDEQHRFGVAQRAALQKNISEIEDGLPNAIPHLLSMTATPIPRTLALTIYGDLNLSLLDEMPQGRQKIITRIVAPANRQKAYNFIHQQVKQGRQVFVICPRIGDQMSDVRCQVPDKFQKPNSEIRHLKSNFRNWDDAKAVTEEYEKLSKYIFPRLKIAMLHGKMKSDEKEKIMKDFKDGKIDILVSTSVIEVGIDIPNATVMFIEGAEHFGLAQLHQFRGRVGRGPHQSYCLLFTDSNSQKTQARLKAVLSAKSGFELAERDLEIRGSGEFYGTRQWGLPDLSMASLKDLKLIQEAKIESNQILIRDPNLKTYPLLKAKLQDWQTLVHLE